MGLDSCGKSTILKNFKPTNGMSIFATYFQVETIKFKNMYVNLWDMSGEAENRENWSQQYPSVDAIIFVVDSTDYKRIEEAAVELHKMVRTCMHVCDNFLTYNHCLSLLSFRYGKRRNCW